MAQLKTINRIINNDFPFMELVKGSSYFYFAPIGCNKLYVEEHRAIGNLASASVYVAKTSDLTVKQWFLEASNLYEKMKNGSHSLCAKIKREELLESYDEAIDGINQNDGRLSSDSSAELDLHQDNLEIVTNEMISRMKQGIH